MQDEAECRSLNNVWEVRGQTVIDWFVGPNSSPVPGNTPLPWPHHGHSALLTLRCRAQSWGLLVSRYDDSGV